MTTEVERMLARAKRFREVDLEPSPLEIEGVIPEALLVGQPPEEIGFVPAEPMDLPSTLRRLYPEMFEPEATYGISEEELPEAVFQTVQSIAMEDPIAFVGEIRVMGRTADTELLLRTFGATDEDIDIIFAPPEPLEIPLEGYQFVEEVQEPFTTERGVEAFRPVRKLFTIQPDYSVELEGKVIGTYNPETGEIEPREVTLIEMAKENLGEAWNKYIQGEFSWGEFGDLALGALGVAGAYIEKYVGRPWETAILEGRIRFQEATGLFPKKVTASKESLKEWAAEKGIELSDAEIESAIAEVEAPSELNKITLQRLEDARNKYGWGAALIAEEVSDIWRDYVEGLEAPAKPALEIVEWINPAYLIPIGGVFGLSARFTTKIPLLGRVMKETATGVQALERGIVEATLIPTAIRGTAKGAEYASKRITKALGDRLLKQTDNLLLEIPETKRLLDGVLADNWIKKTLTVAAKIPPIRVAIEKALGWRVLLKTESQVVEDIVGKAGVAHSEITRMGTNAKAIKFWELQDISRDPVKLFGFNKNAYSAKMAKRLLPEYEAERGVSGTLEHIFTKPERYNWEGLEKGLQYATRVHEINTTVLNLLKKEGVPPEHVIEDWIHRVVVIEGKIKGVKRAFGARVPYERHRKFETMAEGMDWFAKHPDLRAHYVANPEMLVTSYIEEAFKKIADARFIEYMAREMEAAGKTFGVRPTERLIQFPELFEEITGKVGRELAEKVVLRTEELSAAKQFTKVINRALRGEKTHPSALAMLERKFPELGKRFKEALGNKVELQAIKTEIKALTEARKVPFWEAKTERAFRMEQLRQPKIGEGYIMQPFAGGKLYEQEFIDAFNKFFGHKAGLPGLNVTSDVAGILRITKAALDFSMPAIQGLPTWGLAHAYMLIDPPMGMRLLGAWYKTFVQSTAAFFRPEVLAAAIRKIRPEAMQRVGFGGSARAVDYFQVLWTREGLAGVFQKVAGKIPFKPYDRAEVAFFGAGELIRDRFWKILAPKAIRQGKEFELARFLDRVTGITDSAALGVPLTVRQLEQTFMWFAPNYTRACLTVLADIFRGGYTGAMTREALGGMIMAGAAMYSGVQYAIASLEGKSDEDAWDTITEGFGVVTDPITKEVDWQPTGRFMTIKVGNFYMGFGGFWYGLLRFAGNIMATVDEVGERETIDLVRIMKHGTLNKKDNPFIYWWYSRSSPLLGAGFELASGKDFLGYPIETPEEYMHYVMTRFEPIWMEQGLNWMVPGLARDNEIPEGLAKAALIPAELFGMRTFPESQWVKFYDKANELIKHIPAEELDPKQVDAWREGKLTWKQLTDIQKMNLLTRYPELNEFYTESQADSAVRDSKNWEQWKGRTDEEKDIYYFRGDNLVDRLITGDIDSREFREMWGEAGQNYGVALDVIGKEPTYEQIYTYFDNKEAKGERYGFLDDLALGEYTEVVFEDYLDEKGDIDWDAKDKAIDEFIEKWGVDTYERIRQMYADKKKLKGLSSTLIRLSDDKEKLSRDYWRLPYKPINEMDEEDEAEGNIPDEYLALWKQAQTLEGADLEAFIEAHPELKKDWRAEFRLNNPEADARLALWGYGGKLQSREAYDLVVKWGRELGIPLEQMGLGLPPQSLIDSYFELNKIVSDTSGSSIQARLYKLEHKSYLEWGLEQGIWKDDLSDENIEALKLRIKWEGKEDTPEAKDDMRRVQMYGFNAPLEIIEDYIEYGHTIDEFGSNSAEAKLFKIDHPELFEFGQREEAFGWDDLKDENIDALRITVQMRDLDEESEEYKKLNYKKRAYQIEFPSKLIDTYIDWYMVERKDYEDDWFLMEHQDFYKAMLNKEIFTERADFRKVPTRVVYKKYLKYKDLPQGEDRFVYRRANKDLDDWLVLAFDYTPVKEKRVEEPPPPKEEVERPSKRFDDFYDMFYSKAPLGKERYMLRGDNPWFDAEGVRFGYWKPFDPDRYKEKEEVEEERKKSFLERLEEQGLLEEYLERFK